MSADDDADHHHEVADPDSGRRIDSIGDHMAIDAALRLLSDEYRLPVVLRDVADLDYAEIAARSRHPGRHGQEPDRPRKSCAGPGPVVPARSGVREPTARSRTSKQSTMNDDELPLSAELASAYLDGELDATERAAAVGGPGGHGSRRVVDPGTHPDGRRRSCRCRRQVCSDRRRSRRVRLDPSRSFTAHRRRQHRCTRRVPPVTSHARLSGVRRCCSSSHRRCRGDRRAQHGRQQRLRRGDFGNRDPTAGRDRAPGVEDRRRHRVDGGSNRRTCRRRRRRCSCTGGTDDRLRRGTAAVRGRRRGRRFDSDRVAGGDLHCDLPRTSSRRRPPVATRRTRACRPTRSCSARSSSRAPRRSPSGSSSSGALQAIADSDCRVLTEI